MAIAQKLVDVVTAEWEFFGRQTFRLNGTVIDGKKEYQDGAWQRVGDYWRFIGTRFPSYSNLNGKDRGYPWSAAFISFCMHEAGAAGDFPYNPGHAVYINKAIRNSSAGTGKIFGRRLNNYRLKPGDLIGYWRGGQRITFDNAVSVGWYQSHTDILVEVGNGVAWSIGGNVGHSVTRREVRLNAAGNLVDRRENWFVAIENNI